jgi:asparagine synthase (glutamine-hydrolysing)
MCGIAGLISKDNNKPLDPSVCKRMCAAIEHRGPDDEGYWHSDAVSVGMRRLSIIDLASGAQPIWISPTLGIVFNGEIYNYRCLREDLQNRGVTFATQSDTEVIVRLYQAYGTGFVERLSGMFAICIIDLEKRRLVFARDRFGEKPLYYADIGGRFYFASELKALMAGMPTLPAVDNEAVYHYLTLRFVPQPLTMWQDVHKLLPGHLLVYDLDRHRYRTERYWTVNFQAQPREAERDYLSEFKDLFYNSVNERILAADVPVGIFLSGGLDSTLITLAAKECGHNSLHSFSIGYADPNFSELNYAKQAARYFGTLHHEVQYTYEDFIGYLPHFVWDSDEPLGDSASIPLRYLARFARQKVKVTLTGEGADEMFGGYNLERFARDSDRRRRLLAGMPAPIFRLAGLLHGRGSPRGETFRRMSEQGWGAYITSTPAHPTHFWTAAEKAALFPSLSPSQSTADLIRGWYACASSSEPLDKYMTVLSQSWLVEDLLMKADKMSMRESLELRCPFLDHSMAEWAQALPVSLRVGSKKSEYMSKALLRLFSKGRIPDEIIHRPKQGFPVPTYEWLAPNIAKWTAFFIEAEDSGLRTLLGFSGDLKSTTESAAKGNVFAIQKIWLLLLLELWLRRWVLGEANIAFP